MNKKMVTAIRNRMMKLEKFESSERGSSWGGVEVTGMVFPVTLQITQCIDV